MRIAFNAQRLAGQSFGVGRYIEYLIRYWSQMLDESDELTIFLREPLERGIEERDSRVRFEVLDSGFSGIPWENSHLRAAVAAYDVLFCPAYTAPIGYRGPLVVATHSVNETEASAHSWLYRQTYARLHRHCARNADAVIVPGAKTRAAVVETYQVPESRIQIVHQGADDAFNPDIDPALLTDARISFFGSDRPYILFVGKGSPRRNIPMLIEAYAQLRKSDSFPHGLVLFGPYMGDVPLDHLCRQWGVENDVVQTDGVIAHHSDLAPVYAAADVFVHPSENEGWSMTTVEAMACGVAVIASRRGGLGEVAEGHAYMLDPPTVDSLAEALRTVLTDTGLRKDLQRRARERGMALRWDIIARQTLDIVRAAGHKGRSKTS